MINEREEIFRKLNNAASEYGCQLITEYKLMKLPEDIISLKFNKNWSYCWLILNFIVMIFTLDITLLLCALLFYTQLYYDKFLIKQYNDIYGIKNEN
jgi:hypothetical protein